MRSARSHAKHTGALWGENSSRHQGTAHLARPKAPVISVAHREGMVPSTPAGVGEHVPHVAELAHNFVRNHKRSRHTLSTRSHGYMESTSSHAMLNLLSGFFAASPEQLGDCTGPDPRADLRLCLTAPARRRGANYYFNCSARLFSWRSLQEQNYSLSKTRITCKRTRHCARTSNGTHPPCDPQRPVLAAAAVRAERGALGPAAAALLPPGGAGGVAAGAVPAGSLRGGAARSGHEVRGDDPPRCPMLFRSLCPRTPPPQVR